MGSQVDIHTCTDTCTYSNQNVAPEEGLLGHACGAIQGHTCLHATMQRGGVEVRSQMDMHKCTDAGTRFKFSFFFEKKRFICY